jgi:hypothetical protein
MAYSKVVDKPNDGRHIHDIISRTICPKHGAKKGDPCFKVYYDSPIDGPNERETCGPAICGARVLSAGFNGRISPNSLSGKLKGR